MAAAALCSAACYIHTSATPLAPEVRRSPTCAEAVTVFADSADVRRPYVPVAWISIWYPADMYASASQEQLAQRKKAASLGANGLILGYPIDQRIEAHVRTLAIFIPDDSTHTTALCAQGSGSP